MKSQHYQETVQHNMSLILLICGKSIFNLLVKVENGLFQQLIKQLIF